MEAQALPVIKLMTVFAMVGGLEISRATAGTFQDMGCVVDDCRVDAFPVSNVDASCVCTFMQAEAEGATTATAPYHPTR
jgi:hypothetical protein